MSDPSSDPLLDAQLRDVPLPEGFADRLRQSLGPSDERMDAMLRDVRMPGLLLRRLHEVPAEVELDERISGVVPPVGLVDRLRRIAREPIARFVPRKPSRGQRIATAASLAAAISVGLAAAVLIVVSGVSPPPSQSIELAANIPVQRPALLTAEFAPRPATMDEALDETLHELVHGEPPEPLPIFTSIVAPDVSDELAAAPVAEWLDLAGGQPVWNDVVLMRYGVLGAPTYEEDELPDLEKPWFLSARGRELPRVRGYDRAFYLKQRVSPPVSPAAHAALQTLAVPLSTQTSSYDRVQQLAIENRTPPGSDVRVEDFLAALDYRFPPAPAGELALRTAAGPSVFGPAGTGLLQVGVQAGALPERKVGTSRLVIAIDASASMGRGGRWDAVRYAVERLLRRLSDRERVSLVIFNEQNLGRWEEIGPEQAEGVLRELSALRPDGGTDLAAGLQQAVSAALSHEADAAQTRRLVLITDSPASVPAAMAPQVRSMFLAANEADVRFDVCDLSDRTQPEPLLAEIAAELEGDYLRASEGRPLYWTLLERLTGQPSVIASETKLTIRFNPRAVAAYRLIGHEANALAALSPPALAAELHAREAATALVEVWFQPNDLDDIGVAELTWRDPASGKSRKLVQRISRLQFAPTFVEAAPSLQAAAIAAETAEQLRGSRDALREVNVAPANPSGWETIESVARNANPALDHWDDYQNLLKLIHHLH